MTRFRKGTTLATALLVGAIAAPLTLLAQPGPGGHRGMGWGWGGGMRHGSMGGHLVFSQLELTDAQKEQVRGVFEQHRAELQAAGQTLQDAFRAQQEAVTAVPPDEGRIRGTVDELAAAQTDMALLHSRIHNEVFQLLTPEQQSKARELEAERQKRFEERRQRRPAPKQPQQP